MILEMIFKGKGMFSMGNKKPVNMSVGMSIPSKEISMAACCDWVELDISKPSDKQTKINKPLSANNSKRLPSMGISKRLTESKTITDRLKSDKTK